MTDIATVRLRIGDRGSSPQFSDAEIQSLISSDGWKKACLILVKAQKAELAGRPDFGGGSLRISHSNRMKALDTLLNDLRNEFGLWSSEMESGSQTLDAEGLNYGIGNGYGDDGLPAGRGSGSYYSRRNRRF